MKKILATTCLLVLLACGKDSPEAESNKGKEACEKVGALATHLAEDYCEKNESCDICQDFKLENVGIDDKLECQGRELSVAKACLAQQRRCEECIGLLLKSQCEETRPSDREVLECMLLIGFPF